MKKKKDQKKRQIRIKKPEFCALCLEGYQKDVDYKDVLILSRFLTKRGKNLHDPAPDCAPNINET